MHNLSLIEQYYRKYIKSLYEAIPEGIYTVNLPLLQRLDLLHFQYLENRDPALIRYFQMVESPEKITLINDEFVIWIVTNHVENIPATYTLVALNQEDQIKLELAFIASGVYNSSSLILRILEKFLMEIQENERMLARLN